MKKVKLYRLCEAYSCDSRGKKPKCPAADTDCVNPGDIKKVAEVKA